MTTTPGERPSWWAPVDGGVDLFVHVVPGAARSEIVGRHGERLRVRIAARAIEGRANIELEQLIATRLGVRRAAVAIRRGQHARDKTVHVAGIAAPPDGLDGA